MLLHDGFNHSLILELRQFTFFSRYWEPALESCIPESLPLDFEPTDTIGYYRKLLEYTLSPADDSVAELRGASTEQVFDFGRAVQADSSRNDGKIYAVNVSARVSNHEHYCLFALRKRLWSADPAVVEGILDYVRLFV
jgi:hypothetical protein